MKKLFVITLLAAVPILSQAQSCSKTCNPKCCDKSIAQVCIKTCMPEEAKQKEIAAVTTIRTDLQAVIKRISMSSLSIDTQVTQWKAKEGESEDESLQFLSQAVTSLRHELLNKVEPGKLVSALRDYTPQSPTDKQQLVAVLEKEIQLLASQAEKL